MHIPSQLFCGIIALDGRGRGAWTEEFYEPTGQNNPNPQLNFRLKPDYRIGFRWNDNQDNFKTKGKYPSPYVLDQKLWSAHVANLSAAYARLEIEKPKYYELINEINNHRVNESDKPDLLEIEEEILI